MARIFRCTVGEAGAGVGARLRVTQPDDYDLLAQFMQLTSGVGNLSLGCAGLARGGDHMKARRIVGGATFAPDVLKVISRAFDEAWAEIAPSVSKRALAIEAARLTLANIVLSLARDDTRDPEPIKTEAVRLFRLKRQISN